MATIDTKPNLPTSQLHHFLENSLKYKAMDMSGLMSAMRHMKTDPATRVIPYGGRPKYVKFAPNDKGDYLPDVFFEDPRTFTPRAGPHGQVRAWGLYPYVAEDSDSQGMSRNPTIGNMPDFDGVQAMMRTMSYQMTYDNKNLSPEKQFTKVLLERKRAQLKQVDVGDLDKRDVIVKVIIAHMNDRKGDPRVWRRFRVSAGIKLSAFQDKAIAPIVGWVRNLHCYTFTDFRDGSLYGPEGMDSVDVTHMSQVGYEYLSDDKYMLAHLFSKEGDKIGYLYDFGDKWYHEIEIEQILPVEASDGAIRIIDGKGMCPGENLHGSLNFEDFLNEYDDASYMQKQKKKREILDCPNYKDFGKPPSLFDPGVFDLAAAEQRLASALSSPNSIRRGPKKFHMPLAPGAEAHIDSMNDLHLKKGQSVMKNYQPENHGYWDETTSNVKDKRREAVCGHCGKPGGTELKTCSGCRQILYCSPEHQKAHWKTVHKTQCSRKYLQKS